MTGQRRCRSGPLGTPDRNRAQGWSRSRADMLLWSHWDNSTLRCMAQHTSTSWSQARCCRIPCCRPCTQSAQPCPCTCQEDMGWGKTRQQRGSRCPLCSWCTLQWRALLVSTCPRDTSSADSWEKQNVRTKDLSVPQVRGESDHYPVFCGLALNWGQRAHGRDGGGYGRDGALVILREPPPPNTHTHIERVQRRISRRVLLAE
jgi:hypothetical protein